MKSKIEQKIEKAREATNEMFAAFDELNEKLSEKLQPEFSEFKEGSYLTMNTSHGNYTGILRKPVYRGNGGFRCFVGINAHGGISFSPDYGFQDNDSIQFSSPEEIALLDSKLAEQGKRFDKEKLELVDILKHKEPIIGEMAIFWGENRKSSAIIGTLLSIEPEGYVFYKQNSGHQFSLTRAILFESVEQYKEFLKS